MRIGTLLARGLWTCCIAAPAFAADEPAPKALDADHVVKTMSVKLGAAELSYSSTTGTLPLLAEDGKERARMFFVYYAVPQPDAARPITFVFNGGPGSSSVWLHLGAFGPKVVELDEQGFAPPPPSKLRDNPYTLLDVTDLVFIDPVTTGYSRAATGENASQFHGLEPDVEAVGEFIRLFTTHFRRWGSPKYVAGESYGTTRAAALASHLQQRVGMFLNGVILLSCILSFETAELDEGNDAAWPLIVPSFCATAWFHQRLAPPLQQDLDKTLHEVEEFCRGEYPRALMDGDAIDAARRTQVAQKLAGYLGVSPEFVLRCNLRVGLDRFRKELLRDQGATVGRLDSRFLGTDRDSAGDNADYDASYANIQGVFSGELNDYVRTTLGYESRLPYEILTGRVQPWRYDDSNRYVNVATRLRSALVQNPSLRVFVGSGDFDLATPYFAADWTFDHLNLDAAARSRITRTRYRAGHMMYIQQDSAKRLREELGRFYAAGH